MYDDDLNSTPRSGWTRLPPQLRAALLVSLPFIAADFFNYYSAGTALALSLPILAALFLACGALAARFARAGGRSDVLFVGATSAFILWGISLLVNGIIALIPGLLSFGTTFLLGLPYICLCGPFQLIGGGLMGALGAWLYSFFSGRGDRDDDY
jgi:hypothetical protein